MTTISSIEDVLKRIEDIRDSLKFSDEILPLLSDLFLFLKDTIPLMLEANMSIKESTDKIPTASENIENITKTTELATNEVMDKLDTISNVLGELYKDLKDQNVSEDQLAKVEMAKSNANEIVFALQFQDIISQQLEHTNRILSAVYERFMDLFKSFVRMKERTTLGKEIINAIESECNVTVLKDSREEFDKKTEDVIRNKGISQDDIDKLFK